MRRLRRVVGAVALPRRRRRVAQIHFLSRAGAHWRLGHTLLELPALGRGMVPTMRPCRYHSSRGQGQGCRPYRRCQQGEGCPLAQSSSTVGRLTDSYFLFHLGARACHTVQVLDHRLLCWAAAGDPFGCRQQLLLQLLVALQLRRVVCQWYTRGRLHPRAAESTRNTRGHHLGRLRNASLQLLSGLQVLAVDGETGRFTWLSPLQRRAHEGAILGH